MKRMKCYIYTRVSTSMQVDGYSLDAQKDKLRKYAEFQNMTRRRGILRRGQVRQKHRGPPGVPAHAAGHRIRQGSASPSCWCSSSPASAATLPTC